MPCLLRLGHVFDRLRFLLFRPEKTSDLWKAAQMSTQLVCVAVHRALSVVTGGGQWILDGIQADFGGLGYIQSAIFSL